MVAARQCPPIGSNGIPILKVMGIPIQYRGLTQRIREYSFTCPKGHGMHKIWLRCNCRSYHNPQCKHCGISMFHGTIIWAYGCEASKCDYILCNICYNRAKHQRRGILKYHVNDTNHCESLKMAKIRSNSAISRKLRLYKLMNEYKWGSCTLDEVYNELDPKYWYAATLDVITWIESSCISYNIIRGLQRHLWKACHQHGCWKIFVRVLQEFKFRFIHCNDYGLDYGCKAWCEQCKYIQYDRGEGSRCFDECILLYVKMKYKVDEVYRTDDDGFCKMLFDNVGYVIVRGFCDEINTKGCIINDLMLMIELFVGKFTIEMVNRNSSFDRFIHNYLVQTTDGNENMMLYFKPRWSAYMYFRITFSAS